MAISKGRAVGYWIVTGLLALDFALGGVTSIARVPQALEGMRHLGYPAYFGTMLGVWKLLGAVAIVIPGWPRLKEWAYAGMFFDVTSAAVSVAASGDGAIAVLVPLVFVGIVLASWALRPPSRTVVAA